MGRVGRGCAGPAAWQGSGLPVQAFSVQLHLILDMVRSDGGRSRPRSVSQVLGHVRETGHKEEKTPLDWLELYPPSNSCLPRTAECDLIWK